MIDTALAHLERPAVARRAAVPAAVMLLAIAIVHLIDGPSSLSDLFYIGALELALTAACVPLAIALIVRPTRELWFASAGVVAFALLLYVLSRTIGLPGASDDIGNWGEVLGLLNIATETALIALTCWALTHD
jgi:hypothetical protein